WSGRRLLGDGGGGAASVVIATAFGSGRMARTAAQGGGQRWISKLLNSPLASDQVVSTESTRAAGGPLRHHAMKSSRAEVGPSATARTEPSGSLRTQPTRPRSRAALLALARYHTPWTRPRMTSSTLRIGALIRLPPHPPRASSERFPRR